MEHQEISDVAKETICILNYFDKSFISKIPVNFLNEIRNLAEKSSITVKIDKDKKLKDQNILEKTKDLISLIYYSYIATKEEKEELIKIWNANELLYQRALEDKYNSNNLFKKRKEEEDRHITIEGKENKLIPIENREGILQKIKNLLYTRLSKIRFGRK